MLEYIREKFTKRTQPEEIQPWFAEEGKIEELVRQRRVPGFYPSETTNSRNITSERVLVVVPPEGVDITVDECETLSGGWEFFAPNEGPSKGMAALYDIDPKLGAKLKERRDIEIRKMELLTS